MIIDRYTKIVLTVIAVALAPDQTWKIVDVDGKAPEVPKIKTLIRWQ